MQTRAFKYLSPLIIYILAGISFTGAGWLTWIPILYAWILMPTLELFIRPDNKNLDAAEAELAKKDRAYDYMLYIIVPLQFAALCLYLASMRTPGLLWWEVAGRTWSMGLLCGTFGINVAHELGHRADLELDAGPEPQLGQAHRA